MDDGVDKYIHGEKPPKHEVVHRRVPAEPNHPENAASRYPLQAILTAGELRLQTDEEHELRQGQCDHRKINALATHRNRADHEAKQHGDCDAGKDTLDGARTCTVPRHALSYANA